VTAPLIGIAGGSGAGKSTIVRELVERLGGCAIELDSYYLDRAGLEPAERERLNYDEPAAIDVALITEHLRQLAAGGAVLKPRYSFETHTRVGVERVPPARLIVVEGLLTFWWETLRELMDLKVYVDAPADLRLARRLQRDVAERGRTAESVVEQYLATVRPMHERYVEPTRVYADLVVRSDGPLEACAEAVLAALPVVREEVPR
jgi:uridine kinase